MRSHIFLIILALTAFLTGNHAAGERASEEAIDEIAKVKDKKISVRALAPISAILPIEVNRDSQPSVQGWLRLLLQKHLMRSTRSMNKQNNGDQKASVNPSNLPKRMLYPFPPRKPRMPIKPTPVEDLGKKNRTP